MYIYIHILPCLSFPFSQSSVFAEKANSPFSTPHAHKTNTAKAQGNIAFVDYHMCKYIHAIEVNCLLPFVHQ